MIFAKLLGPVDLIRAQALCIHEKLKVAMID